MAVIAVGAVVDVARLHAAYPSRTRGRQQLELHHGPDMPRDEGLDGDDHLHRRGFDGFGLAGVCAAALEARHRLKAVEDAAGDQLVADGPLEGVADTVDLFVDVRPTPAHIDHPLANGLQASRAELGGWRQVVEFTQRPEGQAELLELFASTICERAVVLPGMDPEAGDKLLYGDAVGVAGELSAGGYPFGDDLVVFLLRGIFAVLAEINCLAVEDDIALAGGFVVT